MAGSCRSETKFEATFKYYVLVYDENKKYQNEWWNNSGGTANCSNAAQITVASGQIASADFQLKLNTPGKISGTVTTAAQAAQTGNTQFPTSRKAATTMFSHSTAAENM